eukprot:CAMPEP_0176010668 /NCGR_PEP_ID=MMETSP0120_2-20121206/4888_1 /TAXON_ID=160619 /ORGANISM="Kryptoperidinium foliaceum, Strain CCMP 1326" /LENGTH=304 /DNA_ID=CAMNT_0017343509 /DNA_START=104 /DNA_END=1015 /DNA_ORIENTATION=+
MARSCSWHLFFIYLRVIIAGFKLNLCAATPSFDVKRLSPDYGIVNSTFPAPDHNDLTDSPSGTTDLNFHGEFHHHEDLPIPRALWSTPHFFQFFKHREHRNHLLKGGGNPTEEQTIDARVLEAWSARSRVVSSAPPMPFHLHHEQEGHHSVVAIYSTVPIIPGLFIKAVSFMGCRLLSHPQTLLPMYEFTLIEDQYQPHGKKPLVWLYNKVTGDSTSAMVQECSMTAGGGGRTVGSRSTDGLFRMTLEPRDKTLRLSYFSMVKVSCSLPKRLLKILPLSKQRLEDKISASMAKQIQSEVMESAE